jgi:hypothetical protein
MNEIAPDPKAVIEALEARIVRLEAALHALLATQISGLYRGEYANRHAETLLAFRRDIFKEHRGE